MWKKVFVLSIVCAFVLALASAAEDRAHDEKDLERDHYDFVVRDKQRQSDEFLEIRERIEKLCAMAREAEAKAKHFWAEAEELERTLKRRFGQREMPEPMDRMHDRLAELREAAKHAKREGHHDKAAELHEKAERMAEEIKAHERNAQKQKFPEAEQRLKQLMDEARQAEERGEMAQAKRLWVEAEEIKQALKREFGHREIAEHVENMHAKIAELKEAAERAEREGHHDKAAEFHKQAHKLAMEIEETAHQQEVHDIKSKIERLHVMAVQAKEAGHHDKAEAILREAKELEHHLKNVAGPQKKAPHKKDFEHQLEKLQDEINHLRRDVEELKRTSSASHQRADRI